MKPLILGKISTQYMSSAHIVVFAEAAAVKCMLHMPPGSNFSSTCLVTPLRLSPQLLTEGVTDAAGGYLQGRLHELSRNHT